MTTFTRPTDIQRLIKAFNKSPEWYDRVSDACGKLENFDTRYSTTYVDRAIEILDELYDSELGLDAQTKEAREANAGAYEEIQIDNEVSIKLAGGGAMTGILSQKQALLNELSTIFADYLRVTGQGRVFRS